MFREYEFDVLVVGAGPVGLFAALELAAKGLGVQIVDADGGPAAHSYALALHSRSLELLDHFGLSEALIQQGRRVGRCAFYEGSRRCGELDYSRLDSKFPFVLVLPQHDLEVALEEALGRHQVKVCWRHRVSELEFDGKLATARIEKLRKVFSNHESPLQDWVVDHTFLTNASYVVGADGNRSIVRQSAGLRWCGMGDPQRFAVFELQADTRSGSSGDFLDEIRVALHNGNADVLWPMGEGRFRFGFGLERPQVYSEPRTKSRRQTNPAEQASPVLSKRDLRNLILERFPWFQMPLGEVTWSVVLRFEHRLVSQFGHDNAWVIGDAAHLAPPVGFHSMNIGLREAHDLAMRLGAIMDGQAEKGSLEGFNQERLREWRTLLGSEGQLHCAPGWVRRRVPQLLSCIPASGGNLRRLAGQIGIELEE